MTSPTTTVPTHEDIALLARQLWLDRGCPTRQDTEIWLEAEEKLQPTDTTPEAGPADTFPVRENVTPDENLTGFLPAAASVQEAITTALQKKDARAPQVPHHTAPKTKPAATGKPVWKKSHSS